MCVCVAAWGSSGSDELLVLVGSSLWDEDGPAGSSTLTHTNDEVRGHEWINNQFCELFLFRYFPSAPAPLQGCSNLHRRHRCHGDKKIVGGVPIS